jgi:hypothetical protein
MDFATLHHRSVLRGADFAVMAWRALWMRPARALVARQSP